MSRAPHPERETTVLLVEDDAAHAEIVLRNFTALGLRHRVEHVSDGETALDYLRRTGSYSGQAASRPGLVLLDLRLPRLGGLEVLAAIKGDARLDTIPVVALTTSSAHTDVEQAYRLGVNSYLVKPFERDVFEDLLTTLGRYWLRWNEQPQA
jgi:CheY-like chemotaxis protein